MCKYDKKSKRKYPKWLMKSCQLPCVMVDSQPRNQNVVWVFLLQHIIIQHGLVDKCTGNIQKEIFIDNHCKT